MKASCHVTTSHIYLHPFKIYLFEIIITDGGGEKMQNYPTTSSFPRWPKWSVLDRPEPRAKEHHPGL